MVKPTILNFLYKINTPEKPFNMSWICLLVSVLYFQTLTIYLVVLNSIGAGFDVCPVFSDATTTVKMSTRIFYITVGCACAVIILIAVAVAIYYLNTQKGANRGYSERIKY